jgi:hypothetical protein
MEYEGATWMSWGRDKDEIAEAFGILQAKDSQRLGSVGSLSGVRTEPAVSAGFAQVAGILGAFSWAMPPGSLGTWTELKGSMPHRGGVPMTYFLKIKSGRSTEATWEFRLPGEFVQDLAAAGASAAQRVGD